MIGRQIKQIRNFVVKVHMIDLVHIPCKFQDSKDLGFYEEKCKLAMLP